MNLAELLARSGRSEGARPALYRADTPLASYRELAREAASLAAGLRGRFGLEAGDRVALIMKNCPEYVTALFGIWWAGLAAVPLNAKLHAEEFAYALADSGASLCFVSPDLAAALPAEAAFPVVEVGSADWKELLAREAMDAPLPRAAESLSWLFYTSGTTGRPKGAMLSAGNLLAMTACYFMDVEAVAPEDGLLHAAPMSHGSGLYILPFVAAAAAQVVPESAGFDPQEIGELCAAHRSLSFFAAPTMVHRLIRHPGIAGAALPGLKSIVYGGGPMYLADSRAALDCLGNRLIQIYGQGESPMTITALNKRRHLPDGEPDQDHRLASVGLAQSLVELRVGDEEGRALPPGEAGEVMVRGPSVMQGYWRRPDATAETLRDGWLWTGDVGALDAWGYLTLKDRSKDLIISGGTNIYPREVEECLLRHPGVAEVSVVGRPDAEWGEEVVAFVVPAGAQAPSAEALDRHCLAEIARFKRPKHYRFLDRLPKNNYGKVMKTKLRTLLSKSGDA